MIMSVTDTTGCAARVYALALNIAMTPSLASFGPKTVVSSCRRTTYFPLGTVCNFVCEGTDDNDPTVSNLTMGTNVIRKACGSSPACPSYLTVQSTAFFIGPFGFGANNKILGCVP